MMRFSQGTVLKIKAEYEFILIRETCFPHPTHLLGNRHMEHAWWQGTSTRKSCKTTENPDRMTFTRLFSALRHIKIKSPRGMGLSGGGCPRPREHQVLLSLGPICLLFSIAGQLMASHRRWVLEERVLTGRGHCRAGESCIFPGNRREGKVSDWQAESEATRLGKEGKSRGWQRGLPCSSPSRK